MKLRAPRWVRRLMAIFRWSAQDRDMDQEMGFHIDAMTREYMRGGMSEADAARAARKQFGNVLRHKEAGHDTRSGHLDELVQDVKSGLRQLTGAPTFAVVAAITLALGIGVNAAVFAVVKSALLDALPYTEADRLVRVYGGARAQLQRGPLSAGTISDIRERQRSLSSFSAFMDVAIDAVYGGDSPQVARMAWVEHSFFDTLGVSATRGRVFRREDALSGLVPLTGGALAPDAPSAVMLTHSGWARLFGSDEAILGRDVRVNGIPRRVIGVLPSNYVGPMGAVDFYFAFDLSPVLGNAIVVRGSQWLGGVGRVKPGVAYETARDEIAAIWTDLVREYPADNRALGLATIPLRESMVGNTRTPLLVLMASAGLVLFITCANLAGALLSRAVARRKEFAIRAALGAGRGRLVRQLLTESIVLAVTGGVAGVVIASVTLDRLGPFAARVLPGYITLSLDWGAVVVTGAIAIATGLLFGTAPAMSIEGSQGQSTVRDDSRGASESRRSLRLRGALVAGQMALCLSLLVGAGLLARSLWAMTGQSLGFEPDGVLTAVLQQLPQRDYATPESRAQFRTRLHEELSRLPGVIAVATGTSIPTVVRQRSGVTLEGAAPSSGGQTFVITTAVSDDYFRTLQIPLRRGRTFGPQELPNAPRTLVISESMARRFWPDGNAIGQRVRLGPNPQAPLNEIVGIVGDVRNDQARPDAEPMAYASTRQVAAPILTILVRAQGDPLALVRPMEGAVASLDPSLALQRVMTMPVVLGEGIASRRLPVLLMTGFGLLALLLASVGVYAMFASLAGAREREFGIRLALGSRPGAIAALVLRQGAVWMAAGLAVGAFGIVLVVRLVRDLLYGVSPFDPITVGASVAILAACAAVALLVPVRRATRVDAAVALRAQ